MLKRPLLMSSPIITIENLSKRYQLGQIGATTLRDSAQRLVHRLKRWGVAGLSVNGFSLSEDKTSNQLPITNNAPFPEELWALKDVSFEVNQGEVLGIIGRNGAGKSTLLKILSRITEPTSGRAVIRGRVASLLEVGTGFHPELSGRDNIYLNGAILGMRHAEIARKFDEIVSFAEVERFIDTPVKHYSSGMYVRLAFAVAAHLEPEILVVDEVLAVGDAEFQAKCLGKMKDVARGGRTVLFVSHNMAAVQALCSHAVVLEKGTVKYSGSVTSALEIYLKRPAQNVGSDLLAIRGRKGPGDIRFSRLTLTDANGCVREGGVTGEALQFHLQFSCKDPALKMRSRVAIVVRTRSQTCMFICAAELTMSEQPQIGDGDKMVCTIPRLPLDGGSYILELYLESGGVMQDFIEDGLSLNVEDRSFFGTTRNSPKGWEGSIVLVEHEWRRE